MTLALRFAARSDVGLLRSGNEDSVYAGPRVLAVADGMGGQAAGEVASAIAIAELAPLDEDAPGSDLLELLRARAFSANDRLREMVAGDRALEGMGTTLTAFLFAGSRLGLIHIGDSRAYLLRDGVLSQITADHTLVAKLVADGRINAEEASSHPQRNLITQALDGRVDIEPDFSVREARAGDRYLLCSDGLTGPVGRSSTLQAALELPDPQVACDRLVSLALRGGGPDNITVIVADVVEAGDAPVASAVIAGAAAEAPQPPPEGSGSTAAARARVAEGRQVAAPARAASSLGPPAHGHRTAVVATLLTVGLLTLVAGAAFLYVRSLYYVGVDPEEHVAIYRGVSGSVGGLSLSSVARSTALPASSLDVLAKDRVENGIGAANLADAIRIVDNLSAQVGCASTVATPTPTPSTKPRATASTPRPSPTASPGPSGVPVATLPSLPTAPSAMPSVSPDACPGTP